MSNSLKKEELTEELPLHQYDKSETIQQPTAIRSKTPSLFGRLIGIKRSFSTSKEQGGEEEQPQGANREKPDQEDFEIPAFLRKNS